MSKFPPGPRVRSTGGTFLAQKASGTSNGSPVTYNWTQQQDLLEVVNDVVVPGARRLLERGVILNNPFSVSKTITSDIPGSYSGSGPSSFSWSNYPTVGYMLSDSSFYSGDTFASEIIDTALIGKHSALAKQAAIEHIDPTSFEFAEDMFELKKSIELMHDPFSVARNTVNAFEKTIKVYHSESQSLKKGSRAATQILAATSAAYLGTKYAYGSALHSAANIYSKSKYFDRINRVRKQSTIRKRAKGKSGYGDTTNRIQLRSRGGGQLITFNQKVSQNFEVRVGIFYLLAPAKPYNSVGQDWGLRLKDLPRGAWAVQPLTWFTDRFYNVGAAIDGAMNLLDPRVTILESYIVIDSHVTGSTTITNMAQPGWGFSWSGEHKFQNHLKSRTPLTLNLKDVLPTFNLEPISRVGNIVDALALSSTRINKLVNGINRQLR